MKNLYKLLCFLLLTIPTLTKAQDSCRADYSVAPGNNTTTKIFTAHTWHSMQKPVREICWTFGDGQDTCLAASAGAVPPLTISHTYGQPGTYTVCVKIRYDGGCVAERCGVIAVEGNTQPDSCKADINVLPATAPLARIFSPFTWHNNNKPVIEVKWTFGDGTQLVTATAQMVTHVYPQPGTYNVCIRVKYDGGCVAEKCKSVTITAGANTDSCKADYSVSATTATGVRVFTPIAWHNNNKPVQQVTWNFGDGTPLVITPGLSAVTHVYPVAGTYNVCVIIKYDGGCIAEKCKPLVILPPADSCRANFEVTAVNSGPLTRKFTALPWSYYQKPVKEVCWKFGNGQDTCISYDSTYTGPYFTYHTYTLYGTYTACVKIRYYGGCVAEYCKPVSITQPAADSCMANFEALGNGANTLSKTFLAQPSHSQNKRPEKICWTFGDGTDTCITYNPAQNYNYVVNHTYQQAGVYTVCVKIRYQGGCEAQKCKAVTVAVTIPADSCYADYTSTAYSTNPRLRKFTALPWHNNSKRPEKICWIFGDGRDTCITYNPAVATNDYSVLHQYANNGIYTVCVKIRYQGGCEAQKCNSVAVGINTQPDSCRADFTDASVQNELLWKRFNAVPWHLSQKRPLKICWTFGDGRDTCITYNASAPANYSVLHRYAQPGTYSVCVKIWYDGGCYAQTCRPISIVLPVCRAQFTDSMISRFKVFFKGQAITATPNDPVTSWTWSFGDGTAGSGQNVVHEYAQPGTYNVCLKIKTLSGCENTFCKTKTIDSAIRILNLAPNPVQSTLYITYYSYQNETGQVKIYSIYGILVKSFTRQMVVGYNNFSTDVSTLTPGPYSLVVQTPTTLTSSVFFKQ